MTEERSNLVTFYYELPSNETREQIAHEILSVGLSDLQQMYIDLRLSQKRTGYSSEVTTMDPVDYMIATQDSTNRAYINSFPLNKEQGDELDLSL
ncbi:MAG: hypothetical protein ACRBHB_18235 [Arenicella sp.]